MREQDHATGYPSLALPYEAGPPGSKRDDPFETISIPAFDRPAEDPLPAVLRRLGVGDAEFEAARRAALANRSDSASELIAAGAVDPADLAEATAAALGLPVATPAAPPPAMLSAGSRRMLRPLAASSRATIAPRLEDLATIADLIALRPELGSQLEIASEADIAAARAAATKADRSEAARLSLSRDRLDLSARVTVTGAQGFAAALAIVGLLHLCATSWGWVAFHLATLLLYLGCILLRLLAAASLFRDGAARLAKSAFRPGAVAAVAAPHPVYSVLVALRDEDAETVDALVASLEAIRWPRSRLQILMVCEENNPDTVDAVRAAIAGKPWFLLVETPPSLPQTKPKALNFALPLAEGEFVVLYDAEDKPGPEQLREAWETFERAGPDLACLQAPLVVTNGRRGWLPAHFAIEYTALFFGLLPWLGRHGLPLPLGGTSNHFRREALLGVGGWDSHNVTEDADLGMRLARAGYRTGTIETPTLEEAPEKWLDWTKQRTRWMKGYAQTWLVHMRAPRLLLREIGARNFLVFQLLFAGMLLSSSLNTLVLATVIRDGLRVHSGGWPGGMDGVLLCLDAAVLAFGFAVYAALALGACRRGHCTAHLAQLWMLPVYWFCVSLATLRALCHLATKPHHWEKTPHGSAARKGHPPAQPAA